MTGYPVPLQCGTCGRVFGPLEMVRTRCDGECCGLPLEVYPATSHQRPPSESAEPQAGARQAPARRDPMQALREAFGST